MPQENTIDIAAKTIEVGPPRICGESDIHAESALDSEGPKEKVGSTGRRKKRRRLKKVRISDALRHEGLDERELAKTLKGVIDRQIPADPEADPDDKFLANMVMGCFRFFDEGAKGSGTGQVPVKLVHNVPRPKRTIKTRKTKAKGRRP